MSGSGHESEILDSIYEDMPESDFSSDVLQHAIERLLVVELERILWSDWGRPERIMSSLHRIDRVPAFSPLELSAVDAPTATNLQQTQGG